MVVQLYTVTAGISTGGCPAVQVYPGHCRHINWWLSICTGVPGSLQAYQLVVVQLYRCTWLQQACQLVVVQVYPVTAGISTGACPAVQVLNPGAAVIMFIMNFIICEVLRKSRSLQGLMGWGGYLVSS